MTHTHTHTAEAVVLLDYDKQQDNELTVEVGDVITDVKQVCTISNHISGLLSMTVYKTACRLQQKLLHDCNRNMEQVAPSSAVVPGDL